MPNSNKQMSVYRAAGLQTGLTLVEILVALAVSSILLAGMVQIFASSRTTYTMQDGLSRMQENGRFALDFLTRDLRMGGYFGCLADVGSVITSQIQEDALPNQDAFNPSEGIVGWDYSGTSNGNTYTLSADAAPVDSSGGSWATSSATAQAAGTMAVPGSDIVRLWRGDDGSVEILSISGSGGSAQTVLRSSPTNAFSNNDLLLVTDCARAEYIYSCNVNAKSDLTQITISGSCGNIASASFTTKAPPGEVTRLVSRQYYIGKAGDDATAPPALFMRAFDSTTGTLGDPQELVRGIENMQISYGVDTNNDRSADQYVDATAVAATDWANVISVRVAVLATSVEDTLPLNETDTNTYNLDGVTIDPPNDRQLRQVFTTTITLRNRALAGP